MEKPELNPVVCLKACSLFKPLTDQQLQNIWSTGQVVRFEHRKKWDNKSPQLGFVNVILDGHVGIRRRFSTGEVQLEQCSKPHFFGGIESLIGTAKFSDAHAYSDVLVFTLTRDQFNQLLNSVPQLADHAAQMRSSVSLAKADEFQKKINPDTRVAPRVPTEGIDLRVKLPGGKLREVENVSISGLGINGDAPGEVGHKFSFEISGSNTPGVIPLTGQIARIMDGSFGVKLVDLPNDIRRAWEDIIVGAMSSQMAPSEEPTLFDLKEPLKVDFILGSKYCSGTFSQLSMSHGTITTQEPLATADFKIAFTLPFKTPTRVTSNAKAIKQYSDSFLIEFVGIEPSHQALISKFISATTSSTGELNNLSKESTVDTSNTEHVVTKEATVQDTNELSDILFAGPDRRIYLLRGVRDLKSGQRVRLKLKLKGLQSQDGRWAIFALDGEVLRPSKSGALIDVSANPKQRLEAIKQHVTLLQREEIRRQVSTQSKDEIRIPRPLQAAALLLMSTVVLGGAWKVISSAQPIQEAPIYSRAYGVKIIYAYDLQLKNEKESILRASAPSKKKFRVGDIHMIHYHPSTEDITLFLLSGDQVIIDNHLANQLPETLVEAILRLQPETS